VQDDECLKVLEALWLSSEIFTAIPASRPKANLYRYRDAYVSAVLLDGEKHRRQTKRP
jgi:hypothetical protein